MCAREYTLWCDWWYVGVGKAGFGGIMVLPATQWELIPKPSSNYRHFRVWTYKAQHSELQFEWPFVSLKLWKKNTLFPFIWLALCIYVRGVCCVLCCWLTRRRWCVLDIVLWMFVGGVLGLLFVVLFVLSSLLWFFMVCVVWVVGDVSCVSTWCVICMSVVDEWRERCRWMACILH